MKFRLAWACLLAVLALPSCSKKEKVITSVCVDGDVAANSLASIVAIKATLPSEAEVESRDDAMVVKYKGREHSVTTRKDGDNTCFDFTPPIEAADAKVQ